MHNPTVFEQEYQKLNPAQKQAVDTIEGPVLVVAGPGTGKTQTLALRVANILKRTQMRPHNILCLTYSTNGARAMRERLRSIIGPDAYGITIETVHTFCNTIILEHPHVFDEWNMLEQVSDVEKIRIVRKAMLDLGPGSILGKPSTAEDRAAAVLSRIGDMKRDGISTENLRALVPTYRAEIATTKTGKQRDTKSQAYKDDLRLVKQFEEFITIYDGYHRELMESKRYDYDDMILTCMEAIAKHDWILAALQERYQYVLVDEFQDLNGAQHSLIGLLIREPMEGQQANIFVVGDDDQAIFRFQGASIRAMKAFLSRFPQAPIITLTENYRSTQSILDAASAVIAHNEDRLSNGAEGVPKNLIESSVKAKHLSSEALAKEDAPPQRAIIPEFLHAPSAQTERALIADLCKKNHDDGTPWNEIAILCRTNNELEPLYETLHAANIPVVLIAKQDLIHNPAVREAMMILRAVLHIDNDAVLSQAIACSCFGCHPAELGALWCTYREAAYRKESPSLRSFINARMEAQPESLQKAMTLLESLHQERDTQTPPYLLERLLKESGLLPSQEATGADPRMIAALHAFYEYIKDWSYEKKQITLSPLLVTLDQYQQERGLHLEYDMPHLTEDGVQLMTAHKAKGLEFDCVIIAHARFRNWGDNNKGSALKLPDHLITGFDATEEKRLKQEDERRLFYVAMTRARRILRMTFAESYPAGDGLRDAQPTAFLAEAQERITERTIPPQDLPKGIETLWQPPIKIDEAFEAWLREQLQDFRLSVTALNCFLRDPQEFLWTQLLKQPQHKAAHLSYGSIVHHALELRNLMWQEGKQCSTDDLVQTFRTIMQERELMTQHEREHYLHEGSLVLERYGKETENDHPIILSSERSITAQLPLEQKSEIRNQKSEKPQSPISQYSNVPIFGKVDRIDLLSPNGQNCRVIDYKTGSPKRTADAVRSYEDGGLFRQLVFYKILCDRSPSFTHTATVFTLDFIGNEKEDRRLIEFAITEAEIAELEELIRAVWGKIVALDFTKV